LSAWLDAPVFPGADQFWMSLPKVAGEEMFLRASGGMSVRTTFRHVLKVTWSPAR
jgi:hypothetical protein